MVIDPCLGLSDEEIDLALGFSRRIEDKLYPTIAGLLVVGKQEFIETYVPGHEVLFQVTDGSNVIFNPPIMREPLLEVFEKVNNLFMARVNEQEIQVGLFRVLVPNYDSISFKEAFCNALIHRIYDCCGRVTVQLQPNLIKISSPGGFMPGISADNNLSCELEPRNKLLSEAFKRIGLTRHMDRGIEVIYKSELMNGHAFPDYSLPTDDSVILCLRGSENNLEFVRMLIEEQVILNTDFDLDVLIVLAVLRDNRRVFLGQLASLIQKSELDAKKAIDYLVKKEIIRVK